ncbi:fatty acid synthase subunit alpha [Fusarium coicis]|nr:fatty acid synthase subunit alpha [Fusarium coicis]
MAWIMGFITHHNRKLQDDTGDKHYIGWVDAKTKSPVTDVNVKAIYKSQILEHTGIRLVEPELDNGYNPSRKQFLHEIVLTRDLPPFIAPPELAKQFMLDHGEKGAVILVPKALQFDRSVASQIPQGWDARRYGFPDWAVDQVGRETNFFARGYNRSTSIICDILQEAFRNTAATWINMLLLLSSGPIRTPIRACATAVESLELGYELITAGKAKFALVGGHDDMTEEVAYEFAKMRATVSLDAEEDRGRTYSKISRPMKITRDGFVEAQGCSIQVLASARVAIDIGIPIYGIVSWVGTASDKASRSVPAPGKGLLTNARETNHGTSNNPLLDITFRKDRILKHRRHIQEHVEQELKSLAQLEDSEGLTRSETDKVRIYLHHEASQRDKAVLKSLGHQFWTSEVDISPIQGALSA